MGTDQSILPRVERTLELIHRWGYAPTLHAVANEMIGGPASLEQLRDVIVGSGTINLLGDFVCLRGHEHLVDKSRDRTRINELANGRAKVVAEDFVRQLVRICPFVDCVALSGSVASGGYVPADDIDFDIFVPDQAKYLTYALSLLLGFQVSLRLDGMGSIRKIICINVIWTRSQVAPFTRKDADLAFELLRCRPIIGSDYFREVIQKNGWVQGYFPQVAANPTVDLPRPHPSLLGRCLGRIVAHPRLLGIVDRLARVLTSSVYRLVHWHQRHDSWAMERLAFLKQAKFPYEFFQD